jgi:putative oxidoreductase
MELNKRIALLSLRLIIGFIFFFQGYGKVVEIGVDQLHEMMFAPDFNGVLPSWFTQVIAYGTSYMELIGGALLILGFFRDWALYGLLSVLVIVAIGHGMVEPIWELKHVVFRLMLMLPLLLLPSSWDTIRLDTLILRRKLS